MIKEQIKNQISSKLKKYYNYNPIKQCGSSAVYLIKIVVLDKWLVLTVE
jgi:hypothetical protein